MIGNADYKTAPLLNPVNDASDIAAVLQQLGFKTRLLVDANLKQMAEAIYQFSEDLSRGGTGLFYYAGHGIQVKGENFLIPVDASLRKEFAAQYEAVNLENVLEIMFEARNGVNLVILDACRNNPFVRQWGKSRLRGRLMTRGLASVKASADMLIAYATEPGGVAIDGDGRNGTYTKYLLRHLASPGLSLEQMFRQVRRGVIEETHGQQIPWESSSLTRGFYFVPPKKEKPKPAAPPPNVGGLSDPKGRGQTLGPIKASSRVSTLV